MTDYAPLTLEKFYRKLIANEIILKMSDVEAILKDVESEYPNDSDIVHFQRAYERADIMNKSENFYKELIANKIILRKADIEGIIKEVEAECPRDAEDVRRKRAYEKVAVLYDKVHTIRQARAGYTGKWNGENHRKTTA